MDNKDSKKPGVKIKYIDRPNVTETFADSVGTSAFDGALLKLELCSTFPDATSGKEDRTLRRSPSGRVVLTASAAVELYQRLQQVMGALERSGAIKRKEKEKKTAVQ